MEKRDLKNRERVVDFFYFLFFFGGGQTREKCGNMRLFGQLTQSGLMDVGKSAVRYVCVCVVGQKRGETRHGSNKLG
jgi:hypothetical protein